MQKSVVAYSSARAGAKGAGNSTLVELWTGFVSVAL